MLKLFSIKSDGQAPKRRLSLFDHPPYKARHMLYRTLLFLILTASFAALARAQQDPGDPFHKDRSSALEMEMLKRREIEVAEKEHRENLERAHEAAQLGSELRDAYAHNKSLDRAGLKKLDRLEKITRRIRSMAGGSDDKDSAVEKAPPQLEAAFSRLAEVSEEMRKGVEKTPRQVVSASVIEHANELLDIIAYIRNLTR
jgi:hypothetical protein